MYIWVGYCLVIEGVVDFDLWGVVIFVLFWIWFIVSGVIIVCVLEGV